jgi:hypothetical protein
MTGSTLSLIIIPIVALIALAFWVVSVLYADDHPGQKEQAAHPRNSVSGGAFTASGGHQVMPHRDAVPPESRQYEDQYRDHGQASRRP